MSTADFFYLYREAKRLNYVSRSAFKPQGAVQELNFPYQIGQFRKPLYEKALPSHSQHQLVKPSNFIRVSGDNQEQERIPPTTFSRRELLLLSASLAGVLAAPRDAHALSEVSDPAESNIATDGSSETNSNGETSGSTTEAGQQQQQPVEDVKSWYRYRGEGFVIRVPPGYEDILEPGETEEDDSSLYGKRAKEKPFAARFASPDGNEVLSIVIKPVSQLRLSFFETTDVKDFGTIKEAATMFVPAGAKLVSAKIVNSKASRIPRTYYMYEFLLKGFHFMLSAGVSKGRVFVLGASTPQSKWKDYGSRLQLASSTFYLP